MVTSGQAVQAEDCAVDPQSRPLWAWGTWCCSDVDPTVTADSHVTADVSLTRVQVTVSGACQLHWDPAALISGLHHLHKVWAVAMAGQRLPAGPTPALLSAAGK